MKRLLLYSGGMDSTVLLMDNLLTTEDEIHLMYFDYGQKVSSAELENVRYWSGKNNLPLEIVKIPPMSWCSSSMITGKENSGDNWKDEYVEARNLIFISYALSYAEAKGMDAIELGFIGPNYYTDTDSVFVNIMNLVGKTLSNTTVSAPFVNMDKLAVMNYGKKIGVDMEEVFEHTITCNTPIDGKPCGKCDACDELEYLKQIFQNG